MSDDNHDDSTPAERAIRAMSPRQLRRAAKRGNALAARILAERSKASGKKAAKVIKAQRRADKKARKKK